MVKKAIIVTPTSLVSNWEAEINKWVEDRIQLIALCESSRDDVVSGIDSFTRPKSTLQVYLWISFSSIPGQCTYHLMLTGTHHFLRDIPNALIQVLPE